LETSLFSDKLSSCGLAGLTKKRVEVLQVHLGRYCNMACNHCYVEASPAEKDRNMSRETAEAVLKFLGTSGIRRLDLTGGAPELHPDFEMLVRRARSGGVEIVDRCNLTVFYEPGGEDLPRFLASNRVEIIASLPWHAGKTSDRQRGAGSFDVSVQSLRSLNELGYGREGSGLFLNLVYNPVDFTLPPPQLSLQAEYKKSLFENYGIFFNDLYAMTNMPITRYAERLKRFGKYEEYLALLAEHFNPRNAEFVMCRNTLAVGWDGKLYDCDFNQALGAALGKDGLTIFDVRLGDVEGAAILNGDHCLGCLAGAGSGCRGALLKEASSGGLK